MVRGYQDVRKIEEPIDVIIADETVDTPDVINATDAEDFIDYSSDPITGSLIQAFGPDEVFIRINGTAGTADTEYSLRLKKNEWNSFSNVVITKISAICESGKTAKVNIQPVREP